MCALTLLTCICNSCGVGMLGLCNVAVFCIGFVFFVVESALGFLPLLWLAGYVICKSEGLETSPPDSNISDAPATSLRSNPHCEKFCKITSHICATASMAHSFCKSVLILLILFSSSSKLSHSTSQNKSCSKHKNPSPFCSRKRAL